MMLRSRPVRSSQSSKVPGYVSINVGRRMCFRALGFCPSERTARNWCADGTWVAVQMKDPNGKRTAGVGYSPWMVHEDRLKVWIRNKASELGIESVAFAIA